MAAYCHTNASKEHALYFVGFFSPLLFSYQEISLIATRAPHYSGGFCDPPSLQLLFHLHRGEYIAVH